MARPTPSMEMFMVGAYLHLVEGCDNVVYAAELPDPKEFWVEVVGRNEAAERVFYVDFPEKFDWYPREMRPDTMVRKLTKRYVEVTREGLDLDYAPDHVHCQVWMPRPPARRVAEALPKVVERLRERHGVQLDIVDQAEVARRVPAIVERALKANFDYDNLFIRALFLAQGRLDYQAGAPMGQEQIEAMYRFPRSLRSAADVPGFIYQFLSSPEIVDWLGFYAPSFDDLAIWLADNEHSEALDDLERALAEAGMVDESADYMIDESVYRSRCYSADELAELTRLYLRHIDALRAEAVTRRWEGPLQVEIDFMLPFLSRACERIDPSQIEREILRYGGSRDLMAAHFANQYPEKHPYRAILRIEVNEQGGERLAPYPSGKCMEVPIADPSLDDGLNVAVTINYVDTFTGYFVLMMRRLAAGLDV